MARSATQSFIGRPQKRFHSPVPFGAFTTVPSKTKMSSGISPLTMASSSCLQIVAELEPERGMPQHVDPEIGDEIAGARFLGIEERHGVAGTGSALEPQEIGHRFLRVLCADDLMPPLGGREEQAMCQFL